MYVKGMDIIKELESKLFDKSYEFESMGSNIRSEGIRLALESLSELIGDKYMVVNINGLESPETIHIDDLYDYSDDIYED